MSIYIIRSIEPSIKDCYIGSCKDMKKIKNKHKTNCYNENRPHYNSKLYKCIRANGGIENFEIIEIASVWKKATKSLVQIKQDYIDMWKPTLNERRAYTSEQQKKQQKKEWKNNNKEHYKQYYEKNKDRIKENYKQYYEKNKDRIKEKFNCECGGKYTNKRKKAHFRTKKHQNYISSLSSSLSSLS